MQEKRIEYNERMIESLEFYNYLASILEQNDANCNEDWNEKIHLMWMGMKDNPEHQLWYPVEI